MHMRLGTAVWSVVLGCTLVLTSAARAEETKAASATDPAPAAAEEPLPSTEGTEGATAPVAIPQSDQDAASPEGSEVLPATPATAAEPAQAASEPAAQAAPAAAPAAEKEAPSRKLGALAVLGLGSLAVGVFSLALAGVSLLNPAVLDANFQYVQNNNAGLPLPQGRSLNPFVALGALLLTVGVTGFAAGVTMLGLEWYFNL